MTPTQIIIGIVLAALVYAVKAVSVSFNKSITGLISASEAVTITDTLGINASPSIPIAQPSSLTVRTSNTVGTLTMTNVAHGIVTGQRIDLYWTGGQCYGAVVGTVAGLSVPIASVSGGSVLPSAGTAISVGIPTSTPFAFTGNNLSAIVASMPGGQNGYFVWNNGSADVYAVFATGGYTFDWKTGSPLTNPFAGATPTLCYMSHSSLTNVLTSMQAAAVAH